MVLVNATLGCSILKMNWSADRNNVEVLVVGRRYYLGFGNHVILNILPSDARCTLLTHTNTQFSHERTFNLWSLWFENGAIQHKIINSFPQPPFIPMSEPLGDHKMDVLSVCEKPVLSMERPDILCISMMLGMGEFIALHIVKCRLPLNGDETRFTSNTHHLSKDCMHWFKKFQ